MGQRVTLEQRSVNVPGGQPVSYVCWFPAINLTTRDEAPEARGWKM
jgi:hypothetical protein